MQIVDFTTAHIEQAIGIAKKNYDDERGCVPTLPPVDKLPDLTPFAENGLGVAAFDGSELVGFLCCCNPWDGAFSIPGLRHVYSPMGANGTVAKNRAKIYARLYQAAGTKWVRIGAASHGICLYTHDHEGQAQFFRYGFGMRTVDAIRGTDEIIAPMCDGYTFSEPAPEDAAEISSLINMLLDGFRESPFFMQRERKNEAGFLESFQYSKSAYIIARHEGRIIAFIRAEQDGETFIQETPGYIHVNAAYCLPEHRRKGINQRLLNLLLQKLRAQAYIRLGVDFESINPAGSGFWLKYFDAYTYGVVRRIDEGAIQK